MKLKPIFKKTICKQDRMTIRTYCYHKHCSFTKSDSFSKGTPLAGGGTFTDMGTGQEENYGNPILKIIQTPIFQGVSVFGNNHIRNLD